MKLIGSRKEIIIKERLIKNEGSILKNEKINFFLKARFSDITSVYCLEHILEEDYDLYTLLVNKDYIVEFELSRFNGEFKDINVSSLDLFSRKLKDKQLRLKLLIAVNLPK
ncbi:hypothetical protein [Proteus hauseri]|uniref:hypothetical protein n=1 Tax=Proteus hauseri TaxID=183417 RepID=UPI0010094122|nr:hypothetical protein [Proteus hauseri]QAV24084.1 hypothetical protein PH4a_12380 [Proteus hauseri]